MAFCALVSNSNISSERRRMNAERVRVSKHKQSEDGIKERWHEKRNKSSTDTHIQALAVSVSRFCFMCCSFIVYFVIYYSFTTEMIMFLSLKNKVSMILSVKESDRIFKWQNKDHNTLKYPKRDILICPSEIYKLKYQKLTITLRLMWSWFFYAFVFTMVLLGGICLILFWFEFPAEKKA